MFKSKKKTGFEYIIIRMHTRCPLKKAWILMAATSSLVIAETGVGVGVGKLKSSFLSMASSHSSVQILVRGRMMSLLDDLMMNLPRKILNHFCDTPILLVFFWLE